ncbi:DNA double-strand break repair rad50 ATPase, putative isoform 1 [Theobroma cacao]|uniref:DNA double-strand break repair rad50 ATPase, putative isoform 1 n=1 Tax=Theobroma cacao TaxID=3641 RepID=A0A061GWJ0_THECC|nr:DNA double-strand break repair rad50 ATPase, putative isoform 1 [Theobroma cacao]EOY31494.1 DNA double-strand break repair rad50 ATPase, putative isoform 1 [Theobroma cacao]
MAGSSATLPSQETDITALKEMLCTQQQLLQKLYAELDEEREASATATNEALSMILRLQGEKAAVKMEASQYKRLAEEKIGHAEESLAIFEDLMYQKEMEISSLEYQIQAYKYKLLSLGCDDLGDTEKQFPENSFSERNDAFLGEKGVKATVRRLSSLPATLPIDFYQKKSTIDEERYTFPAADLSSSIDVGNFDQLVHDKSSDSKRSSLNSAAGDYNSYWEQIRMLDEKVKEISDCKEVGQNNFSNVKVESVSGSTSSSSDPSRAKIPPKCHKIKSYEDSLEKEAIPSSACSSNAVHDIFEVPDIFEVSETSERNKTCFNGEKSRGKSILEGDNRLKKPDLIQEEPFMSPAEDEINWIKKNNFQSAKPEKKSCKLRGEMNADCISPAQYETERVKKNNLPSANHEKKLCKLRGQTNADCKSALLHPATGVNDYRSELQQLTQRVEQLESGRNNTRHEISEGRGEELNLLRELREQLNSIQSEMRNWRPKKSTPSDEVTLLSLKEAMLHFWL